MTDVVLSEPHNCEIGKHESKGEGAICILEETAIRHEETTIKHLTTLTEDGSDENDRDGPKSSIECTGDCA